MRGACRWRVACGVWRAGPFLPGVEEYRQELLFRAEQFAEFSSPAPAYEGLRRRYWERVYAIYDHLPQHVDPRSHQAIDRPIEFFAGRPDMDPLLTPVSG